MPWVPSGHEFGVLFSWFTSIVTVTKGHRYHVNSWRFGEEPSDNLIAL